MKNLNKHWGYVRFSKHVNDRIDVNIDDSADWYVDKSVCDGVVRDSSGRVDLHNGYKVVCRYCEGFE